MPSAAVREDGSRTRFLDFALAPVASEVCGVVAVLGSGIGMTCSRESCMSRATRAPTTLVRLFCAGIADFLPSLESLRRQM